jgi:preprotein translocase SecF subunit
VGYSLNDKIVVFDRVRENLHKYKRDNFVGILNRSVNETLPRTVLTGGSVIAALLSLLLLAGPVIRGFSAVMAFGVVLGTFSSMFVGPTSLLAVERRWPGEDVRGAKTLAAPAADTTTPGI